MSAPTRVHSGLSAVALEVLNNAPPLCPTQTVSELPSATAIELIKYPWNFANCSSEVNRLGSGSIGGLISVQAGPAVSVTAAVGSFDNHSDAPPASMRLLSL